jgi:hypothetical protein
VKDRPMGAMKRSARPGTTDCAEIVALTAFIDRNAGRSKNSKLGGPSGTRPARKLPAVDV